MRKYKYLAILFLLVACNTEKPQANEPSQATQPTDAIIVTRTYATSTVFPTDSIPISTDIPSITNTATVAPILLTPSPWPTVPFIITPDADQLIRWQEYEKALAIKFIPSPEPEDILCEWVILGQSEQDVYVWAFCQVSGQIPTGTSAPAVIYLETGGAVQNVEHPRDGSFYLIDVSRLFPPDVQKIIFAHLVDVGKLEAHIYVRLAHPEPPLIVLEATQTP